MRELVHRHCPGCGDERAFEQPPCAEGHGGDCPEWACVDCGMALIDGLLPIDDDPTYGADSVPSAA